MAHTTVAQHRCPPTAAASPWPHSTPSRSPRRPRWCPQRSTSFFGAQRQWPGRPGARQNASGVPKAWHSAVTGTSCQSATVGLAAQISAPTKALLAHGKLRSPRPDPRVQRSLCAKTQASAMGSEAPRGRVLITFDVDGTLVTSVGEHANKMHKGAFSHAFKELFGVDGTIDAIKVGSLKHHGSTDKLVAVNTLLHYGVPKEVSEARIDEITESMLEYARAHLSDAAEGLQLLPGVERLLQTLRGMEPHVVTGLVTGNLEEIAWMKMEGLGIGHLFTTPKIGGFGSDNTDRGELVKIAALRAVAKVPGEDIRLHVHVGDTPNDILAAQYGNARPLGVCTGIFPREDLQNVVQRPDASILDSLQDLNRVLASCDLENLLFRDASMNLQS